MWTANKLLPVVQGDEEREDLERDVHIVGSRRARHHRNWIILCHGHTSRFSVWRTLVWSFVIKTNMTL